MVLNLNELMKSYKENEEDVKIYLAETTDSVEGLVGVSLTFLSNAGIDISKIISLKGDHIHCKEELKDVLDEVNDNNKVILIFPNDSILNQEKTTTKDYTEFSNMLHKATIEKRDNFMILLLDTKYYTKRKHYRIVLLEELKSFSKLYKEIKNWDSGRLECSSYVYNPLGYIEFGLVRLNNYKLWVNKLFPIYYKIFLWLIKHQDKIQEFKSKENTKITHELLISSLDSEFVKMLKLDKLEFKTDDVRLIVDIVSETSLVYVICMCYELWLLRRYNTIPKDTTYICSDKPYGYNIYHCLYSAEPENTSYNRNVIIREIISYLKEYKFMGSKEYVSRRHEYADRVIYDILKYGDAKLDNQTCKYLEKATKDNFENNIGTEIVMLDLAKILR